MNSNESFLKEYGTKEPALPTNESNNETRSKRFFKQIAVIISAIVLITSGLLIYFVTVNRNKGQTGQVAFPKSSLGTGTSDSYEVKAEKTGGNKIDIFIKDTTTGLETFFMSFDDVYADHYHSSEFHNGNLYIIKRIGIADGSSINSNWRDELWRYDSSKNGSMIYSNQGLDFRVASDEQNIAIHASKSIILLDYDGRVIKEYKDQALSGKYEQISNINLMEISSNTLWLSNSSGPTLNALIKIDLSSHAINTYDLAGIAPQSEYSLNAKKEELAISTYPAIFDVEGSDEFIKSGKKVELFVYDLATKKQTFVSSSVAKRFSPKWIDSNILEYNNPNGEGRITTNF